MNVNKGEKSKIVFVFFNNWIISERRGCKKRGVNEVKGVHEVGE